MTSAFRLTVIFPELSGNPAAPETPVRLEVSLGMPPVFETRGSKGLTLGAGDVTVSLFLTPPGKPEQLVTRLGLQLEATLARPRDEHLLAGRGGQRSDLATHRPDRRFGKALQVGEGDALDRSPGGSRDAPALRRSDPQLRVVRVKEGIIREALG